MFFKRFSRRASDEEEDEEEELSFDNWWWDTKQKLLYVPRLVGALFHKPEHDGVQNAGDLVYQYGQAVKHIPSLLRRLAFKTRTLEDELQEAMLRGNLRKAFNSFDLLMIGLGIVIGSGAFKLTGQAQATYAGSAVMVSYAIAGLACCCAAACYAELCVEYPVSGSAFTYVMVTFGEYPAFITLGMLLVQYLLGMAAVARGFSQFTSQLLNQSYTLFVMADSEIGIDFMAFGVVIVLSIGLSFGLRESSFFLSGTVVLKLFFIMFISVAGFVKANGAYFTDNFMLPDAKFDGVFQATAFIFFAYVAFDAVCIAVEETHRPERIPAAILGTVIISGIVYMIQSVSLSLLIDPETLLLCVDDFGDLLSPQPEDCTFPSAHGYSLAFTVAFNGVNLPWMQFIVAIAALLGITTSLLVGLYSVARLAMVGARSWLLPPFLARISPRTQTPIIAQMSLGIIVAIVALLMRFTLLSELVSMAALFAMWIVCNVVLFRRYYPDVKLRFTAHGTVEAEYSTTVWWMPGAILPRRLRRVLVWFHIFLINALSIGFIVYYRLTLPPCDAKPGSTACYENVQEDLMTGSHRSPMVSIWVAAWFLATVSMFLLCPMEYQPKTWAIKWWLLPFMPSFAILLIVTSAGAMANNTYEIFIYYFLIITVIYVFFSLPMSYIRLFTIGPTYAEQLTVIELVEVGGKYIRWDDLQTTTSLASPRSTGISFLSSTVQNLQKDTDKSTSSAHSELSNRAGADKNAHAVGKVASRTSTHAPSLPALSEMDEEENGSASITMGNGHSPSGPLSDKTDS